MFIPPYWRGQKERYGLVGEISKTTGGVCFPPGRNKPEYSPTTGELIGVTPVKVEVNRSIAVPCENAVKIE
jgi:hypothetical protein